MDLSRPILHTTPYGTTVGDGPANSASVVLAANGDGWLGSFAIAVAALIQDITREGNYGPARIELHDDNRTLTGELRLADRSGFYLDDTRVEYIDVAALAF